MRSLSKVAVLSFTIEVCDALNDLLLLHGVNKKLGEFLGVDTGKHTPLNPNDLEEMCSEQADALVDACYYILNLLNKKDVNPFDKDSPNSREKVFYRWWNDVYEFTSGSKQIHTDQNFHKEDIEFITKMILSEIWELCDTVTHSTEESERMMRNAIEGVEFDNETCFDEYSLPHNIDMVDPLRRVMEECWRVSLEMGIDLDQVFVEVHRANMDKRDPKTGKFIIREDGKVLKPEGWKERDIKAVIRKQLKANVD